MKTTQEIYDFLANFKRQLSKTSWRVIESCDQDGIEFFADCKTLEDIEDMARAINDGSENMLLINFDQAVALMDDDIRESVSADLAPCTDAEFLTEYCKRHLEKYGEEFTI